MVLNTISKCSASVRLLGRWLTASTCALTLESEGAQLLYRGKVWQDRKDVRPPCFYPEFIVKRKTLTAFYLSDSPFGLRSGFLIDHIHRGLAFLGPECVSVILTRTEEAFRRMFLALQDRCTAENRHRIFLGDLAAFQKRHGHCTVVNADGKQEIL